MTISEPELLIVDFRGQLTYPIGRVLRQFAKVRSAIFPPDKAELWLKQNTPKAVILSGSGASVTESDAPEAPETIFKLRKNGRPIPILGICYGMQYLAHHFGGRVEHVGSEYGPSEVTLTSTPLFRNMPTVQKVWMSHGDSVTSLPRGFRKLGRSTSGAIAAMENPDLNCTAVQWHPEATQSEFGSQLLATFAFDAGCKRNWEPTNIAENVGQEVLDEIGDGKVIVPWSCGVDSTTLVRILLPVLGDRIAYFNIDCNQHRASDPEEIRATAQLLGGNYQSVNAHSEFLPVMSTSPDETRRADFQKPYGNTLIQQAIQFGATHVPQGTLGPDLIESGKTGGYQVVQHHNDLELEGFAMLHPFRHLFKPEIREIATAIGLPPYICQRQPCPGPGLYVRQFGGFPTPENTEIVRWADAKAVEILKRYGLYDQISQLVVALDLTLTAGVKGDKRYKGFTVFVRPFNTYDFMTGEGLFLPEEVVRELCREIPKHPKICRVVLDYSPKAPARTEYI